mmetsp:Transcript_18651/g.58460  ORF Transcript_18651/g.58460 Transcript_18651/m.58460 type:complete len:230 (-) Transcript_18651:688-1377(-)
MQLSRACVPNAPPATRATPAGAAAGRGSGRCPRAPRTPARPCAAGSGAAKTSGRACGPSTPARCAPEMPPKRGYGPSLIASARRLEMSPVLPFARPPRRHRGPQGPTRDLSGQPAGRPSASRVQAWLRAPACAVRQRAVARARGMAWALTRLWSGRQQRWPWSPLPGAVQLPPGSPDQRWPQELVQPAPKLQVVASRPTQWPTELRPRAVPRKHRPAWPPGSPQGARLP